MYVRGWGWGGGGGVQGVGPVQAPMSSDNFDAVIIDLRFCSTTPGTPVSRRPSVVRLRNENPQKKTSKKLFWYASNMRMPLELVHS